MPDIEDGLRWVQAGDGPIRPALGFGAIEPGHADYLAAVDMIQSARAHALVTGSRGCRYQHAMWSHPGRHRADGDPIVAVHPDLWVQPRHRREGVR